MNYINKGLVTKRILQNSEALLGTIKKDKDFLYKVYKYSHKKDENKLNKTLIKNNITNNRFVSEISEVFRPESLYEKKQIELANINYKLDNKDKENFNLLKSKVLTANNFKKIELTNEFLYNNLTIDILKKSFNSSFPKEKQKINKSKDLKKIFSKVNEKISSYSNSLEINDSKIEYINKLSSINNKKYVNFNMKIERHEIDSEDSFQNEIKKDNTKENIIKSNESDFNLTFAEKIQKKSLALKNQKNKVKKPKI